MPQPLILFNQWLGGQLDYLLRDTKDAFTFYVSPFFKEIGYPTGRLRCFYTFPTSHAQMTLHWINHYPVIKYLGNQLCYPPDRDSSIG